MKYLDKIKKLGINFSPSCLLTDGSLNVVCRGEYSGRDSVLKLFNNQFKDCQKRFSSELGVLQQGISDVTPLLLDYSENGRWIVMDFVNGQSLKEMENKNNKIDLDSLVLTLRKVYSQEVNNNREDFVLYINRILAELEYDFNVSGVKESIKSSVNNAIKYMNGEKDQLPIIGLNRINGDLNGANILFNESGKVNKIVDWEFSHVGCTYMDLAKLTNIGDKFSLRLKKAYFEGCCNEKVYNFFLTYFLTRMVVNNSEINMKKMAFSRPEKIKVVEAKAKRLEEMFR